MTLTRLENPVFERFFVAICGILSLGFLDFPFWEISVGSWGWINLSTGFQLALEGANPDLPNLIWQALPSAYSGSQSIPVGSSLTMSVVVYAWWIILGALLVEILGFVALLFKRGQAVIKLGRLIALGGKFVFIGGLLTAAQVMNQLYQFSARYGVYGYGFYPGSALLIEPFLGIVIWVIGARIRHSVPIQASTRTRTPHL